MSTDVVDLLRENVKGMQRSIRWLRRSHEKCLRIGVKAEYSEEDFDAFENLLARYARSVDLIVNKVFRSIDAVELEDSGTMIDVVNRSEKRGIVDSADRVRELKDLRNDIVHEYETDDLRGLFQQALDYTPEVFTLAERVEKYCRRFADQA